MLQPVHAEVRGSRAMISCIYIEALRSSRSVSGGPVEHLGDHGVIIGDSVVARSRIIEVAVGSRGQCLRADVDEHSLLLSPYALRAHAGRIHLLDHGLEAYLSQLLLDDLCGAI